MIISNLNMSLVSGGKRSIPPGYLIYLKRPNSGSGYTLPAIGEPKHDELFALLGPGFWFDDEGNPISRGAAAILEWEGINKLNILFGTRGLAVYSLDALHTDLAKARTYLRIDPLQFWPPYQAILHYDAEAYALEEATGGQNPLNHNVLAPQYQRQADGSYINVGAQPAVDTFDDGFVGLRSCGAVTNLLPNTFPVPHVNSIKTDEGDYFKFTKAVEGGASSWNSIGNIPNRVVTTRFTVRAIGSTANQRNCAFGIYTTAFVSTLDSIEAGPGTLTKTVDGTTLVSNLSETEDTVITMTTVSSITAAFAVILYPGTINGEIGSGCRVKKTGILTATAYPVPYVPPGVTQPASNATATNGVWFSNPLDSELWKSLTGSPLTLATRIKMGVGSGDLPNDGRFFVFAEKINGTLLYGGDWSGSKRIIQSYDGVNAATQNATWVRNAIIKQIVQVNTAGTQFRAGYMIEGTHTAIQWSSWANYDGSFDPSTLYRLMYGYNNPYPMWLNKLTVWKRQVSDTELLEAWS